MYLSRFLVEAAKEITADDDSETFLDLAIGTSTSMGGGVAAAGYAVASALKEGVNFLASMFRKDKKQVVVSLIYVQSRSLKIKDVI